MRSLMSLLKGKQQPKPAFSKPVMLNNPVAPQIAAPVATKTSFSLKNLLSKKSELSVIESPSLQAGGSFDWINTGAHPEHIRHIFEMDNRAIKSIRMLHQHIDDCGENARRIAIVSAESGIEASAITLSLGRKLSDSAMRVIAIDMALSKPILSKIVDEKSVGLTDMLVKGTSFAEVIQGDEQSRLNIISAGTSTLTLESMFTHRRMDLTFEAVTRSYDRIIMDFGALNSRYYADKISQLATFVIVVGLGDGKHQQLVDLYARYRETVDLCVMMADATMNETAPQQRVMA